ncbi:hypothetical protein EFO53_13170 [Lacticaseibacillus rhamnosus]|uniref:Uncharacterized protein n=1 Tax=Lacticaseibacillus rhamnosus (strain LMS2-1) TaxID=525361 RepID=C2JW76_LACRM|nr:hypothetical protein HMPREF0539_1160 [Lacticaseibacillus rhamnosus LMS2-1]KDS83429.1 hypothetical protein LR51B_01060 [Lacticaseibacillus rhamnosus 51B]KKW87330.1 hypothetical protein XA20_11025 [Lacticaseibacillus rhamnosus]OFP88087.1 hypothetical protein HMPREF2969_00325 [Lactobacillus sp. HMSC056D05]OFR77591.1 hypothetical protein HMPREF2869_06040 [Lactobacillus sp. HMSC061B07]
MINKSNLVMEFLKWLSYFFVVMTLVLFCAILLRDLFGWQWHHEFMNGKISNVLISIASQYGKIKFISDFT